MGVSYDGQGMTDLLYIDDFEKAAAGVRAAAAAVDMC